MHKNAYRCAKRDEEVLGGTLAVSVDAEQEVLNVPFHSSRKQPPAASGRLFLFLCFVLFYQKRQRKKRTPPRGARCTAPDLLRKHLTGCQNTLGKPKNKKHKKQKPQKMKIILK